MKVWREEREGESDVIYIVISKMKEFLSVGRVLRDKT